MKKSAFVILLAAMIFLTQATRLISQSPQPGSFPDKSAVYLQALQAMKTSNQQLIEKQQKTLLQLDDLQKDADQIRILARRS